MFGGAEITALKWRFIRGERVVTVGLSWDKPTAGQVRSASLRTITNTQIGLICWSNLFIWGSMEGRVDAQGYSLLWFIHLPSSCFCFLMGNKFWVFKDAVNSYLNRSWDISKCSDRALLVSQNGVRGEMFDSFAQMWAWSTKPVISHWGIFVAIAKNTLYGSKLEIFLLCQKSLGYKVKIMFHEDIFYIAYHKYINLFFDW